MNIVHLIDSIEQVNFGIWNAATATSTTMNQMYGARSFVVYGNRETVVPDLLAESVTETSFASSPADVSQFLSKHACNSSNAVVVSHGCWRNPTLWGKLLSKLGFGWVYTPHGMLEPWSMSQGRLKKTVYFSLIEKPAIRKANFIRAVSSPEAERLRSKFPNHRVALIPNCVDSPQAEQSQWAKSGSSNTLFLFLGRLHKKKCVVPLAKAFANSALANRTDVELVIAGPDDGELGTLSEVKKKTQTDNLVISAPMYGNAKQEILKRTDFFLLPSQSEGLPTAVLEAMSYGCVPIISSGCNFPEAFAENLAIEVAPNQSSIKEALGKASEMTSKDRMELARRNMHFVEKHYTIENVTKMQYELYQSLLSRSPA